MAELLIHRTMPAQIAERLRRDIISGKLKPGEPLREKELSERFGVSRGPIREVFRQLTQQGLLVSRPNKGVRVAPHPSVSVRPLIVELRRKIETFVLDSIFDQITEQDIATWEGILADIKDACQRGDADALVDLDVRFHQAVIQSHDDEGLFTLWQPIMLRMLMQYNRFSNLMDSYHEHERILEAIRRGDKTGALEALEANLQ